MDKTQQGLPSGYALAGREHEYIIERSLGQGTFGITYLAKTRMVLAGSMGRGRGWMQVAVKEFFMRDLNSRDEVTLFLRDTSDDSLIAKYRRAFMREATNLSQMDHPHIVHVIEVIEANNTAYIVMEYVEGCNLDNYVTARGSLPENEALDYCRQLCDALCYMHERKMLHLDVKPKNVMCDDEGHVCLIDFGLSKQYMDNGELESSTTIGLGTPGYAPIEQGDYGAQGSFRPTLDIYALGATFYKMVTGETPPLASEVLNDDTIIASRLSLAGISNAALNVIVKAMSPLHRHRYQSVAAMREALVPSGVITPTSEDTRIRIDESITPYIVNADHHDDSLVKDSEIPPASVSNVQRELEPTPKAAPTVKSKGSSKTADARPASTPVGEKPVPVKKGGKKTSFARKRPFVIGSLVVLAVAAIFMWQGGLFNSQKTLGKKAPTTAVQPSSSKPNDNPPSNPTMPSASHSGAVPSQSEAQVKHEEHVAQPSASSEKPQVTPAPTPAVDHTATVKQYNNLVADCRKYISNGSSKNYEDLLTAKTKLNGVKKFEQQHQDAIPSSSRKSSALSSELTPKLMSASQEWEKSGDTWASLDVDKAKGFYQRANSLYSTPSLKDKISSLVSE